MTAPAGAPRFTLRSTPSASPPASRGLRVAAAGCAGASVVTLGTAGLLAPLVAALLVLVVVAAAVAPARWPEPPGAVVRKTIAGAVLAAAATAALLTARGFAGTISLAQAPVDLGPRLALLVVGVLVAQLLLGERQREVVVSLVVAGAATVLALAGRPGAAVVAPLLVAWPALVTALALAHAGALRDRADVVATVSGPAADRVCAVPRRLVVGVTVMSAVVAALVVLLAPHPAGMRAHRGLGGEGSGGASAPGEGADAGRSASSYAYGDLDLRARGSLPSTPVADIPLGSPALWRGSVLDVYDGTGWRRSSGRFVGAPLPGGPDHLLPSPDDPGRSDAALRIDLVRPRDGFSGVLLAPGRPVQVTVDADVRALAGGGFLIVGADGRVPASYVVRSAPSVDDPAVLRAAAGPQPLAGWSGTLPAALPERVRHLAQRLAAGRASRYDQVRAVERYLRGHATYRLDSPVPPAGQDAVDHFLFDARTGFCEQFASAEVVLLRAVGTPARLATGFAGGVARGDHRTLRAADAHAWVEVYYPGIGWAPSDPTAGARLAAPTRSDRLAALLRSARGRLLLAGLIVGAALAGWGAAGLVGAVRRVRRRRRSEGRRPPLLAAYDRFERALRAGGAPRLPAETLAALGQRPALRARRDLVGALAVVERASYAASPPDETEAAAAVRALDEAGNQLVADRPTAGSGARPRRRRRG